MFIYPFLFKHQLLSSCLSRFVSWELDLAFRLSAACRLLIPWHAGGSTTRLGGPKMWPNRNVVSHLSMARVCQMMNLIKKKKLVMSLMPFIQRKAILLIWARSGDAVPTASGARLIFTELRRRNRETGLDWLGGQLPFQASSFYFLG